MADDFEMHDSEELDGGRPFDAPEVDTDEDWDIDPEEFYAESADEDEDGEDQTVDDSDAADETDEDEEDEEDSDEAEDDGLSREMQETLDSYLELDHLGEKKKVNRDEAKVLAQKGLDYDRIRSERDTLKAESKKNRGVLAVLKQMADEAGMTVEDYIDYQRIGTIKAKETNLDSVSALLKARNDRLQIEKHLDEEADREENERIAREEAAKAEEQKAAEARHKQFIRFSQKFPKVQATEIPKEVWDEFSKGEDLVTAYALHLANSSRAVEAENAKLRQEQKNKSRSAGSMKSHGGKKSAVDIDALWDDGT